MINTTDNKIFHYQTKTLPIHIDSFGHVNNSSYLVLYEQARWDILNQGNWEVDRIQKDKIGPVLLNVNLSFKKELKLGESIAINSYLRDIKNKKVINFYQEMVGEKGELASTALFEIGLFDLQKRKLINITNDWLFVLGRQGNI
jgi:thioesterase III